MSGGASGLTDAVVREIRERVRLADVIGRHVALKRAARGELVGLCPFHAEKSGSFTVVPAKGFAHCFGCGWHGDAFAFVIAIEGCDFVAAACRLADDCGVPVEGRERRSSSGARERPLPPLPPAPPEDPAPSERERIAAARALWRRARPAAGTLVETYLRSRGITLAPPLTLRFLAELAWRDPGSPDADGHGRPRYRTFPAMIAAMQDAAGRVVAVHRTWLAPDGHGKAPVTPAKRMLGRSWGAAIRLAPARPSMGFAEGIETGLSVLQVAGPGWSVWAAGSLGNLAGAGLERPGERRRHPERPDRWLPTARPDPARPGLLPPRDCREAVLLADADGDRPTGAALIARAATRWRALPHVERVRVSTPPDGMDFNDLLQREAA